MIKTRSIQLTLLLLILGVSFSCNKVKETPEPDQFLQSDLVNLNITADSGKATINIVDSNQIKSSVSIRFDQPEHGSISPHTGTSSFRYLAHPGYEGIDSIQYHVCRTGNCKDGNIRITVKNNPCQPTYAEIGTDTFYLTLTAGKTVYMSAMFPGDKYCPGNFQKIENPSSMFSKVTIVGDSIRMETNRVFLSTTDIVILYSNRRTPQSPAEKVRVLKIRMETSANYCDEIFRVADLHEVTSIGSQLQFYPNSCIPAVTRCVDDLDPAFFELYTSPNFESFKTGSIYKIKRKPGGSKTGFIYYIFRNMRHVADTGRQQITFFD